MQQAETTRRLPMPSFVREIQKQIDAGFEKESVHRFLSGTMIEPESLDGYIQFEEGRYTRHLVFKSPEVELLVLCWDTGQKAPVHGHEGELCWARVERGRLRFVNYRQLSSEPLVVEPLADPVDAGEGYLDGPADIHSVENPAEFGERAVSLHIYSKPYAECDIYDLENATRRRVQLRYDSVADEVR